MKSFKFNRKKEDLLPVMKAKAEKANIKMTKEKDKISLMLETWSAYQHQMDNMILCGIVTVLLIGLIVVVTKKSKGGKNVIENLLNNLDLK